MAESWKLSTMRDSRSDEGTAVSVEVGGASVTFVLFEDAHRNEHGFLTQRQDFRQFLTSSRKIRCGFFARFTQRCQLAFNLLGRGAVGIQRRAQRLLFRRSAATAARAAAAGISPAPRTRIAPAAVATAGISATTALSATSTAAESTTPTHLTLRGLCFFEERLDHRPLFIGRLERGFEPVRHLLAEVIATAVSTTATATLLLVGRLRGRCILRHGNAGEERRGDERRKGCRFLYFHKLLNFAAPAATPLFVVFSQNTQGLRVFEKEGKTCLLSPDWQWQTKLLSES
jgi:hypothetical protein